MLLLLISSCGPAAPIDEPGPAPSAPPPPVEPESPAAVSGLLPVPGVEPAYLDRPPSNLRTRQVDAQGVAIYTYRITGEREDHPVVYAQYGLTALIEYERTGAPMWLDRAVANADRLIDMRTESDGAWWYAYPFDWTYVDRTLTAPWWSGMAQGQALSLFSRLAELQPDEHWREAADATWASFEVPRSDDAPWFRVIDDGYLWFEEYAGDQPPLLVLNGHLFAAFGLYDYFELTGDPQVAATFDAGATTILENLARFRVAGGVSYYCAQPDFCQTERWQDTKYHDIHIWQLETMERLSGSAEFGDWADRLRSDFQAPEADGRRVG